VRSNVWLPTTYSATPYQPTHYCRPHRARARPGQYRIGSDPDPGRQHPPPAPQQTANGYELRRNNPKIEPIKTKPK